MLCIPTPRPHILDLWLVRGDLAVHKICLHTAQYCTVCSKEPVLEGLLHISLSKGFLFGDNFVNVLSRKMGHFFASMTIIDTKESKSFVWAGRLVLLSFLFIL